MFPLPSFTSPSPGSQTAPLLFPHHNPHIYIHHLHFYILFVAQLYLTLALPPAPPFSLFSPFYGYPPATRTIPHPLIPQSIVLYSSPSIGCPSLFPSPCLPLPPIFAFSPFYGYPPATSTIPHT